MASVTDHILSDDIYDNKMSILWDALNNLYQFTVIDKDSRIVYMNKLYLDFLGITEDQAIGSPITDFIPNSRLPETIISGSPTFDDIFEYEDGRQLIYSKIPVKNHKGEVIGVVSVSSLNTVDTVNELYNELATLKLSNELYARQLRGLNSAPSVFDNIVGVSPKIIEIKNILNNVINSRMPILLTGESGTGKEVFANAIHNASNWHNAPFVRVNCAAIPKELLESELFGYEPGTFELLPVKWTVEKN